MGILTIVIGGVKPAVAGDFNKQGAVVDCRKGRE